MSNQDSRFTPEWVRASYGAMRQFTQATSFRDYSFVGKRELDEAATVVDQWAEGWRICFGPDESTLVFAILESNDSENALFELFRHANLAKRLFARREGELHVIGVIDTRMNTLINWVKPLPGISVLQVRTEYNLMAETEAYCAEFGESAQGRFDEKSGTLPTMSSAVPAPQHQVTNFSEEPPKRLGSWLRLVCYVCRNPAEVRSFQIVDHPGSDGKSCSASGRPARIPSDISRSLPFACQHCGAATSSNAKTGEIYAHKVPGTLDRCEKSRRYTTPRVKEVEIMSLSEEAYGRIIAEAAGCGPGEPHDASRLARFRSEYPDQTRSSIYALNGGAPGSARR